MEYFSSFTLRRTQEGLLSRQCLIFLPQNFSFQAIKSQCFRGPGDRPEVKNFAIVITDGVPFPAERRQPTIQEAEALRLQDGSRTFLSSQ